jgi:hypothetical protein
MIYIQNDYRKHGHLGHPATGIPVFPFKLCYRRRYLHSYYDRDVMNLSEYPTNKATVWPRHFS